MSTIKPIFVAHNSKQGSTAATTTRCGFFVANSYSSDTNSGVIAFSVNGNQSVLPLFGIVRGRMSMTPLFLFSAYQSGKEYIHKRIKSTNKTMQELIKVNTTAQGSQVVSARDLYGFLDAKAQFTNWCSRMFEYGFEEGKDYVTILLNRSDGKQGKPQTDYALTLDTAKEIAMLQRSDKGKQARQYFIECEKQLKLSIPDFSNPAIAARAWADAYEAKQLAERKVENLQIGLDNLLSWVSILKVSQHNKISEKCFDWRILKKKSQQLGYDVKRTESGRFEYQNLYHVDVFRVCYPQYNYDFKVREYN